MNPGQTSRINARRESENEVQLISQEDGVWAHYWDGHLHPIPPSFVFPKNQTLLHLWLSWHLPDVSRKVCPFKLLKADDVEHIPRGAKKLYDMRLVMEVLIMKIQSIPTLHTRYLNNIQNIRELTHIFKKVKNIFSNTNPKRKNDRIGQSSWQTFVRDARILKYKIPFESNQEEYTEETREDNSSSESTNDSNNAENMLDDNSRIIDTESSTSKRKRQTTTSSSPRKNQRNEKSQTMESIDNFADEFQLIFNENEQENIEVDEFNRFVSISCSVCKSIKTQHRCLYEVKQGFSYNGKSICAKAFCAPCGSTWGCEGGPWRCQSHI